MSDLDQPRLVDALAVGAHPDDVELNCGGTLLALRAGGRAAGVADLTQGELASRGSVEARREESAEAAKLLGLAFRVNLGLADGDIPVDSESRLRLIRLIRECRPRLVLTHSAYGHPDHGKAAALVEEAVHHAGLAKIDTGQPRHRPGKIAFWIGFNQPETPDLTVDVSEFYEQKERAIRAYASQLSGNDSQPETYLSQPDFLERVRSFHRHLGNLSGCRYAEGFRLSRLPKVADLVSV